MPDIVINKRATANLNIKKQASKSVAIEKQSSGSKTVSGTPFASAKDNVLNLYMYTLKQMEKLMIDTSAGFVKFTITFDEYNFYLAYSDDSPAPIAGVVIQDDSRDMYDEDYIFKSLVLTFPSGWVVGGVFFNDSDNILGEGDAWRLADIQRHSAWVAKETTSQEILTAVKKTLGTPLVGQPSTIFAAIAQSGQDSKQTIMDAINYMGGSATTDMTWAQLAQQIEGLQKIHDSNEVFIDSVSPLDYTMIFAISPRNSAIKNILKVAHTEKTLSIYTYAFEDCTNLEEVYMPNATYVGQMAFNRCTNIKKVNFMNATSLYHDALQTLTNLIDLTTGAAFASNVSFYYWNPTEALKSNSSSLVDAGETFNNNLEKFLYNIREHFAANLTDRTGLTPYTITFNGAVKAAILADQTTADAFTNKNWTIA